MQLGVSKHLAGGARVDGAVVGIQFVFARYFGFLDDVFSNIILRWIRLPRVKLVDLVLIKLRLHINSISQPRTRRSCGLLHGSKGLESRGLGDLLWSVRYFSFGTVLNSVY